MPYFIRIMKHLSVKAIMIYICIFPVKTWLFYNQEVTRYRYTYFYALYYLDPPKHIGLSGAI